MFFADPIVAFANIGRALRAGARLVLMVWQSHERNEWSFAIRQSLTAAATPTAAPAGVQSPFSLAERAAAEGILRMSGFGDVSFTDVHEPVFYGPDSTTAYDFVLGLRSTKDLLANLDAVMTEHALQRLRTTLAEHETGSGVFFDSRAWIITARRD